jgi:hypothetical protein
VLIITRNLPLMFIQGPPVFFKVDIDEESTSVFVLNEEEKVEEEEEDDEEKKEELVEQVNLDLQLETEIETEASKPVIVSKQSVSKRLTYLAGPFQRQVYTPLKFIIGDKTLTGSIEKMEDETVLIDIDEGENELVAIKIAAIEEILWRGQPFE